MTADTQLKWFKYFLIVISVTLLCVLSYYLLPELTAKSRNMQVDLEDEPAAVSNIVDEEKLKGIAEFNKLLSATVKNGNWAHEHLEEIAKLWRTFNGAQRKEILEYRIFQQFKSAITGQILVQRTRSQRNNIVAIYQERALKSVARELGIQYKEDPKALARRKTQAIMKHIKQQDDEEIAESSVEDQKLIMQQLSTASEVLSSGQDRQVQSNTPRQELQNAQLASTSNVPVNTLVSSADANELMKDFASAYQSGDLKMIKNLFINGKNSTAESQVSEYRNLFSQTVDRNIDFKTANWVASNDAVSGSISYTLSFTDRRNRNKMHEIGNLDVVVSKHQGEPKIARLQFNNSISQNIKNRTAMRQSNSALLTESELSSVMLSFIDAYNQGDINRFMEFFAENARADDKTTLAGIQQDYKDFFTSTSSRSMAIDRLKWNISGNEAAGKGKLIVTVQSNSQEDTNTLRGEIEVKVEKIGGQILIKSIEHNV